MSILKQLVVGCVFVYVFTTRQSTGTFSFKAKRSSFGDQRNPHISSSLLSPNNPCVIEAGLGSGGWGDFEILF